MEPELPSNPPYAERSSGNIGDPDLGFANPSNPPDIPYRGLKWVFVGPHGLRAGWSALIFVLLLLAFGSALVFLFTRLHLLVKGAPFTASNAFFGEVFQMLALLAAGFGVALIEGRSILDYNLRGEHRTRHFFSGLVVGFAALSTLVGALALGGWLHFGAVSLHGLPVLKFAALWGSVFLMVGCVEEGTMRCFLQSTFTRGMNFWWAFGSVGCICALVLASTKGNGNWGVYLIAMLGLLPCLLLHLGKSPQSGFWQAAWVTSTLFGSLHTGNNGENWVGIFAAAFIGFVFCVSIWVTGSAWWAIGCHAAWDWAETYFYGTADSGFVAPGHLLSTSPTGNPLWSGGADGPEGSLLILPVVLLMLAWLLIIYRRDHPAAIETPEPAGQLAS